MSGKHITNAVGQFVLHLRYKPFSELTRATLPALLLAAGAGLVLTIFCAVLLHRTITEAKSNRALWAANEASRPVAARPNAATKQADFRDFPSALPVEIDTQRILAEVQRATSTAGVTFGGAQIQRRESASGQLGRTELTLSLRGSYSGCKWVATEVLNRFPNATLIRLAIRKSAPPADLDATMVLALWGAPGEHSADGPRPEAGR